MSGKNVSGYVQFMQDELKSFYPATEIRQFVRIVFEHLLDFSTTDLLIKGDTTLDSSQCAFVEECINRLKNYEPIQYITGETDFLDLKLKVTPATLIPRPETEELVMWVAMYLNSPGMHVLDIGTGSGCIALGIKSRYPEVIAEAWDVSDEALKTAKENAETNNLDVKFEKVDILNFEPDEKYTGRYDVIVSNPPYVRESEKELMEKNVLDYEPHLALFVDDSDPLLFYRVIAVIAKKLLKTGGMIFFEINEAFGEETKKLLESYGYSSVEVKKDINGKDRMVKAVFG
jgi:release factor glutamine methyltransferase